MLALLLTAGLGAQTDNNKTYHHANEGIIHSGAAKDITFDTADILFWAGQGSNSATFIVGWDDESAPTAYAWGVRWSGSATALSLIDSICAYDNRVSYAYASAFMSHIFYDDSASGEQHHGTSGSYWCYYLNGDWAPNAYGNQPAANGDVFEVSSSCTFTMTTATAATQPGGSADSAVADAAIDSAAILYWVGTGSNYAILSVNWAEPDTCLAWGYRFEGDSVTLQEVMQTVDSADWRFSCEAAGYVSDIHFIADSDTLGLTQTSGNYWWSNLNGLSSMGLSSVMRNGDFAKWGDASIGTVTDTAYGYPSQIAFTTAVMPVSIPAANPTVGPYCGAVGTAGCEAVAADSSAIVAWATGCAVERGWQDIATQGARVSYGADSMATGPVSLTDNLTVVSLGDGGTATLTFARPIENGNGPDFCVFENSFDDRFLELAFVEVSSDGETFVRFPATSLTQTDVQIGSIGVVNPTFVNNLAGKYRMGYGTPFDLSEIADSLGVDVSHVTHVRIVDVVGSINEQYATRDAAGRIVNDPYPTESYSGGFDLAGIGVIHQSNVGVARVEAETLSVWPNPASSQVQVRCSEADAGSLLRLYDAMGREVMRCPMQGSALTLSIDGLPRGIYILSLNGTTTKLAVR